MDDYSLSLIDNDGVLQKIADIDCFSASNDLRMFFAQKPTDMSKKEATASIMRVSIRLAKFVVNSVVSAPLVNIILKRRRKINRLTLRSFILFVFTFSPEQQLFGQRQRKYAAAILPCNNDEPKVCVLRQ